MRDEEIQEVIQKYCGNEMALLKRICFPIISKFGGLSELDYADFYSIANATVWTAAKEFNKNDNNNESFDLFLKYCILRKFKTEMTRRNRKKRISNKVIISIDASYDDDGRSYKDIIDSGFDINNEIDELKSDGLDRFLSTLSKKQIKIVDLIMQGYSKDEIKEILGISEARYQTCIGRLRCFDTLTLLHDAN